LLWHMLNCRFYNNRRIIAIALTTAVIALLCRCTTLSTAEELGTENARLSDRVFDIRFDDSIPITVRLDQTGLPDANKEYRIRIEYVERSNTSGDIAEVPSTFLNFYFLAYGFATDGSFVAVRTQLVIGIWEHVPEVPSKTCHQWFLTDENVDDRVDIVYAESFTENRWNVVQEISQIPVPTEELEEYSKLYRRCVGYTLKRMGFASTADFYENL